MQRNARRIQGLGSQPLKPALGPAYNDIKDVWRAYKQSPTEPLRNVLMETYLHLVRYNAERVHVKLPDEVELDDLMSSGIFGLMDAINAFEASGGATGPSQFTDADTAKGDALLYRTTWDNYPWYGAAPRPWCWAAPRFRWGSPQGRPCPSR